MYNRIVTLVDMDCFYCQVEARINSNLQGKPMAVVQYNDWKGGGIIAVNYEARDRGVTRYMRGDEAKKICPEIELVRVATVRGKADLTKYRDASREVFNVICEFSECVQRASIDEAYIDLTEAIDKRLQMGECITSNDLQNTFIVGYGSKNNNNEGERAKGVVDWLREVNEEEENDTTDLKRLALGAVIVEEMRAAIFNKTSFKCSAGIAHNKIMAKLVAGLHKPNRQTLLPATSLMEFFRDLPVQKVKNLGGKFGNDVIEKLGCKFMADLSNYSERDLKSFFDEKTGTWLYNIARGIDLEPVTARLISKSIGCCKQFRGVAALKTKKDVLHWIGELAHEIAKRLDEDAHMNKRKAQLLTVSVQQEIDKKKTASSRSVYLVSYETEGIASVALSAIKRMNTAPQSSDLWTPPLLFLGISAGKFKDDSSASNKMINHYFQNNSNQTTSSSNCNYSEKSSKVQNEFEEGKVCEYQSSEKCVENKTESNESERVIQCDKENNNETKLPFFQRYCNKSNKGEQITSVEKESAISVPSTSLGNSVRSLDNKLISVDKCSETVFSNNNNDNSDNYNSCLKGKFYNDDRSTSTLLSPYFRKNDVNGICSQSDINDLSISPSEIFPDLDNVDKEVLSMLPLKLQKKILSRISENQAEKKLTSESIVDESMKYNNSKETKSNSISNCENNPEDSPSVPASRVVTTAHVHSCKDELNVCGNRQNMRTCLSLKKTKLEDESNHNLIDKIKVIEDIETVNFSQEILFDAPSSSKSEEENERRPPTLEGSSLQINSYSLCPNCNENILRVHFQEHLDHHVALELHQQLNSDDRQGRSTDNNRSSNIRKNKTPTKRKRGQYNKKGLSVEGKKPRSILSFFVRK